MTTTAKRTANNYTVSFDVNGGNALPESESKKQVTYDSPYGVLPETERVGYTFDGWFTEKDGGKKVESGDKVVKLTDHALYARWSVEIRSESSQKGSEESDSKHGSESKHGSDSKHGSFSLGLTPFFSFIFL